MKDSPDLLNAPDQHPTDSAPPGAPWIRSPLRLGKIDSQWGFVTAVMLVSGIFFFGWRGLMHVVLTGLTTLLSHTVIRLLLPRNGPGQQRETFVHVTILGLMLGLCLPLYRDVWVPLAGGLILGIVTHGVGRTHRLRVHPVGIVLLIVCGGAQLYPSLPPTGTRTRLAPVDTVLKPERVIIGDAFDVSGFDDAITWSWWSNDNSNQSDAIRRVPPYSWWLQHQHEILRMTPDQAVRTFGDLRFSSLGDVVLGAIPGSIGATSRVLLIALGFYLMVRRLTWWPMAVTGLTLWVTTHLILPVSYGDSWSMVLTRLIDLGPIIAIVYVGCAILTSPFVLIVLILAPLSAPMNRTGKLIYGALLGSTLVIAQWFIPTPSAGYLSLVLCGSLAAPLDRIHFNSIAK